jgi:putative addiction module component (TIGR02574 family)
MSQPPPDYRKLSVAERIQLVEDIWDSIAADSPDGPELSEKQREEIRRRVLADDADPSSAVPWEQVRAELFKRNP